MAKGGGVLVATAVLFALGFAAPVVSGEGRTASVGLECEVGRAASDIPSDLGGGLRVSNEFDIGCGRFGREPVALVGYIEHYRGHRQLCFNLELRISSAGIDCRKEGEPWYGGPCPFSCLRVFPGPVVPGKPLTTEVAAVVPLGTSRVMVNAGSGRRAATAQGLVAPVEGQLLESFAWNEPVVVFAAIVSGCFHARAVRIVASAADGTVLDRDRGQLSFAHPCERP